MQRLEGSGTPVLYIGRKVLKGSYEQYVKYEERQLSLYQFDKITICNAATFFWKMSP